MTEFENNVRLMRHWQKEYFTSRSRVALEQMVHYERIVDNYIDELQSPSIQFDFGV